MIKINLTAAKQQTDLTNIAGLNLTKIKIVPVLLCVGALYLPDFFVVPLWEEEITSKNSEVAQLRTQLSKLKTKVQESENLEKQINELRAQEENLGKKLLAVKQAISEKKNPTSLLLYIAKNIPEDLWMKELSIDGDTMIVKGEALSYASVGNFVTSLRSSVFIRDANIMNTNSSVKDGDSDKRRIESFEVRFSIARFEQ